MILVCQNPNCKREFKTSRKKRKYCSLDCYRNRKPKITAKCQNKNCRKEFIIKKSSFGKYCSQKCANLQIIENKRKEKIDRFLDGKLKDGDVRRWLIREFVLNKQRGVCAICKNPPIWNNKSITFIVDHIDGNWNNNNPKNIRVICPNCNSQTPTFTGRNKGKNKRIRPSKSR